MKNVVKYLRIPVPYFIQTGYIYTVSVILKLVILK